MGDDRIDHKRCDGNAGPFSFLVRWYYGCYPFFGYCCVAAEFTYVLLYVLVRIDDDGAAGHDDDEDASWDLVVRPHLQRFLWLCLPGCVIKQVVNVFQLCSACYAVAECDAIERNDEKRS